MYYKLFGYCEKCQTPYYPGDSFCSNCGSKVSDLLVTTVSNSTEPTEEEWPKGGGTEVLE